MPNPAKNLDYVGIYSPATVRPSLHTSDLNQGIDYSAYLSTSYFNLAPIAQRPFVRQLFCGQKILLLESKTYFLFQIPYVVGKKIFSSEYTFHILIIYSWKLEMSVSQGLELNATYDFGQWFSEICIFHFLHKTEHNYAQPLFWDWEFSIESQTEGRKKPITNMH